MTDTISPSSPKVRITRQIAPVIYAEGIAQMLVGFPNSRILLSQLTQPNGEGQDAENVHHVACELVVPTAALIEMAQGILKNLGDSKAMLQEASTDWAQKLNDVFETLPQS